MASVDFVGSPASLFALGGVCWPVVCWGWVREGGLPGKLPWQRLLALHHNATGHVLAHFLLPADISTLVEMLCLPCQRGCLMESQQAHTGSFPRPRTGGASANFVLCLVSFLARYLAHGCQREAFGGSRLSEAAGIPLESSTLCIRPFASTFRPIHTLSSCHAWVVIEVIRWNADRLGL